MTYSLAIAGSSGAAKPFLAALKSAGLPVQNLSPGASADGVEVLLLMPRDLMESERLLFEEEAYARSTESLTTIILAATLSPRYVRALRARIDAKITLIDAPPVGTSAMIEAGQNTFLLGGPAEALDRLAPLFACLGQAHTRMGDYGTASAAKALQDCLQAASAAMTRSALDWAEAQGIEGGRLVSLLDSTFRSGAPRSTDPASFVTNSLPEDNAGAVLVRNVESALDVALKGVHLTPPRGFGKALAAIRARHLH
ncbi:MAG: NAD(P)-binding domain-containing protein [Paracoccaceae bacterium]